MKLILGFAVLALSTLASAMPAVGDTATFSGTTVGRQGQQIAFQLVETLQSFDQAQQKFQQVSTTTAAGIQPIIDTKMVAASDLISSETVDYVLANCAAQQGVLENVTVPAGNFNTCRITDNQGASYNIGPVPFAVVKAVQPGSQTQMQLMSYQAGH